MVHKIVKAKEKNNIAKKIEEFELFHSGLRMRNGGFTLAKIKTIKMYGNDYEVVADITEGIQAGGDDDYATTHHNIKYYLDGKSLVIKGVE